MTSRGRSMTRSGSRSLPLDDAADHQTIHDHHRHNQSRSGGNVLVVVLALLLSSWTSLPQVVSSLSSSKGSGKPSLPLTLSSSSSSSSASSSSLLLQSSTSLSLNGNSNEDVCYNFSVGDVTKGEFYSPRYPNEYPNNTECIKVLTAPFGSFIRIEFRDQFSLEDSDTCEYDRLEIRNGNFGYSDLIDVLCGHNFPNEISSTDRYLWLRFKSDESIEYSGFRAVYHFIPLPTTRPEPPNCYFEKTGSSGYVRSIEIPDEVYEYYHNYKVPIECIWNITVQPGWQMYINFEEYQLSRPNDCEVNYIDIYESILSEEKRKARFCGTATEPQKSDQNVINVRFHAKEGIIDKLANPGGDRNFKFDILFTAFRTNDRDKCIPDQEFDCDDGTCIDLSLKCNGQYNCKYRYDEDSATTCLKGGKGVLILTSDHMIVILIVFFALVVGMCASIIVSCWGKIQERKQRELDYKLRRSRETSMEAGLDRTMTVTSLDKGMMVSGMGSSMDEESRFAVPPSTLFSHPAHSHPHHTTSFPHHLQQTHPTATIYPHLTPTSQHRPILQVGPGGQQMAKMTSLGSTASLHRPRSHPKLSALGHPPLPHLGSSNSSQEPVIRSDEDEEMEGEDDEEEVNGGPPPTCYVHDDVMVVHGDMDARHGPNLYRSTSRGTIVGSSHSLHRLHQMVGPVQFMPVGPVGGGGGPGSHPHMHVVSPHPSHVHPPHVTMSHHHHHPSMDEEEEDGFSEDIPTHRHPHHPLAGHPHQPTTISIHCPQHYQMAQQQQQQQQQQQEQQSERGRPDQPDRASERSSSESPIPPPPPPPAMSHLRGRVQAL